MYPIDPSSTLSYACARIPASPLVSVVLHISACIGGSNVSPFPSREREREMNRSGESTNRSGESTNRYRDEIIAHSSSNGRYDDGHFLSDDG